jgi:preprotein translocase subunit SecG
MSQQRIPVKLSKNTAWFATGFTLLMILLLTLQGQEARSATGQAANQSKSKPAPAKQEAAKKDPPTLGFNRIKDVSPHF